MKTMDMKRSKAHMKEMATPSPVNEDPYPYGLRIRLDKEDIKKLGMSELPEVGHEFEMHAMAKVTSVNASASEGSDEQMGMEMQIMKMGMMAENNEEETDHESARARKAESAAIGGKAQTLMHNAYRGRK